MIIQRYRYMLSCYQIYNDQVVDFLIEVLLHRVEDFSGQLLIKPDVAVELVAELLSSFSSTS